MKKALAAFFITGFIFFGLRYILLRNSQDPAPGKGVARLIPPNKRQPSQTKTRTIFVPYWSEIRDGEKFDGYDRVIFFGLEAGEQGIEIPQEQKHNDLRFGKLDKLQQLELNGKEKWITLNMIDGDVNEAILADRNIWEKISGELSTVIKRYAPEGIVLDLEMGGEIPVSGKTAGKITEFIDYISIRIRNTCPDSNTANCLDNQNTKFAVLLYGDTFYRKRPYDVKKIAAAADEIMVMAYDFHKSLGEPGPNFPLDRRSLSEGGNEETDYDYDFKTMVADFSTVVPKDKMTVVFGMFGYDWPVDEKKRPISRAKALTLQEIMVGFLEDCRWQSCTVRRDDASAETEVDYVKSEIKGDEAAMYMHVIWFEDSQSAKTKAEWLLKQGIGNIGYWAYGYF